MKCNFFLSALCVVVVLLCHSQPTESSWFYDGCSHGPVCNTRFANLVQADSYSIAISAWRCRFRLKPLPSRWPPLLYLILLTAGDIDVNPGPTAKFPCTVCGKAVKDSDQAISCDRCDNWTHASCCNVDASEHNRLAMLGDTQDWYCPPCSSTNHLSSVVSHISGHNSSGSVSWHLLRVYHTCWIPPITPSLYNKMSLSER